MTGLSPAQHLDILRVEGTRLASMPAAFLDAPVPALPDWTLERVVRHTGKIHQWVTGLLASPPDVDPGEVSAATAGMPRGIECLPAYRAALDGVVEALATHDPDQPVASFLGVGDMRFWCRRQAHEVTVHRMDAADAVQAAGGPAAEPLEPHGATDGIDEWLHVFVGTRYAQRSDAVDEALRGRTVGIDVGGDRGWIVEFATNGNGCEVTEVGRPQLDAADSLLSGRPEAVLLTCWRRRRLETLDVCGDAGLAASFHDILRF